MARCDILTSPEPDSGGAVVAPILVAAVVLVAPIVLWAQFGDGDPLHTIEVAPAPAGKDAVRKWAFTPMTERGRRQPVIGGRSKRVRVYRTGH